MQPEEDHLIGKRIGQAVDEFAAAEGLSRGKALARLGDKLDVTPDTITRWERGETSASAVAVWALGRWTNHPFGWFAGELESPSQRLARIADRLERRIVTMEHALVSLRGDLVSALREVVDEREHGRAERAERGRETTGGENGADVSSQDR